MNLWVSVDGQLCDLQVTCATVAGVIQVIKKDMNWPKFKPLLVKYKNRVVQHKAAIPSLTSSDDPLHIVSNAGEVITPLCVLLRYTISIY